MGNSGEPETIISTIKLLYSATYVQYIPFYPAGFYIYTDGTITPSANGIGLSDDYIYMSAGNSFGGTFQLHRNDLTFAANEAYSDAKGIALNGGVS